MSFSFRSAVVCVGLSVLASTPVLARGVADAAPLPAGVIVPTGTLPGFIDINLAGWETWGGFRATRNSTVTFNIGAGTVITGFSFTGLSFDSFGTSWRNEFTVSVNATNGNPDLDFMDWGPSSLEGAGAAGPLTGAWGSAVGGAGPFGAGRAFTAADGEIFITVYEAFDDPFGDTGLVRDALVSAGTLRVFLAPIPEPGTYGMMALGLLAIGATLRKRQVTH
jgi:hypothetical protein